MSNIREATDSNFDELVLQNDKPVVVDFWAAWCGPCRMVAPEIDKLAAKYDGSVDVVKVDVDASPQTAMRYGIMSIPTVAFFAPGQPPRAAVGFRPLEALEAAFAACDAHLELPLREVMWASETDVARSGLLRTDPEPHVGPYPRRACACRSL